MGTFGLALLLTTLLNCLNGGELNFIQIQFCEEFCKNGQDLCGKFAHIWRSLLNPIRALCLGFEPDLYLG